MDVKHLAESTLTDKTRRCVGAYHGVVDYLYGRASALIRSGLQPHWHWRKYVTSVPGYIETSSALNLFS